MQVIDPGHEYTLANVEEDTTQTLQFIKKEPSASAPAGVTRVELLTVANGTTTEEVIAVLIDRLTFLSGVLPDEFTKAAIEHLGEAFLSLRKRTADREARGVEGTHEA